MPDQRIIARAERKLVRQLTGYSPASVAGAGIKSVYCPECRTTFDAKRIPASSPGWMTASGCDCTHTLIRKYHSTATPSRSRLWGTFGLGVIVLGMLFWLVLGLAAIYNAAKSFISWL